MTSSSLPLYKPLLLSLLILNTHYISPTRSSYSYYYNNSYNHYPPSPPSITSKKVLLNPIDACWASNPKWSSNRQALANCAVGFGKSALGGKYGKIYIVTDSSDDAVSPKPGTLRYGAIQTQPLWIIFSKNMIIKLKNELIVNSFKTIDGRGVQVEIGYGPCITIQDVNHVIIHGLGIHNCQPGKPGLVRSSPEHVGRRGGSDGDAIVIFASSNVWIDHCSLSNAYDGLIDVIHGSTAVTISNNFFFNHDKVMLFGHKDGFVADKKMKVTVAFNRFAHDLIQRMPRVRNGYTHVANNRYDKWEMYAIGGSSDPTILSEGNYYVAPDNPALKQVTKREAGGWKNWKWRSTEDYFLNGAYFVQSGWGNCAPAYLPSQKFTTFDGKMVPFLTANAGTPNCYTGKPCIA
ncbi:putative pectate lyase [Dioscorea sansibarensis]